MSKLCFHSNLIIQIKEKNNQGDNLIAEKNNSKDYIFHKVKRGETLYQIAKRNNVKVSDLINLNQLTNNSLLLGSYLKIKKVEAKNNIKLFDELVEQLNTLTIKENKYLKYKNKYLQLKKSPVL